MLCDAGFETDRDDISLDRYVFFFVLHGGAVDWKSSKQSTLQCLLQNLDYIAPAVHYANGTGSLERRQTLSKRFIIVRECVELGEIRDYLKFTQIYNLDVPFTKLYHIGSLLKHAGAWACPASSFM
ncbi:hypothetical protein Tco_1168922 [Tanacetum coccineum]